MLYSKSIFVVLTDLHPFFEIFKMKSMKLITIVKYQNRTLISQK